MFVSASSWAILPGPDQDGSSSSSGWNRVNPRFAEEGDTLLLVTGRLAMTGRTGGIGNIIFKLSLSQVAVTVPSSCGGLAPPQRQRGAVSPCHCGPQCVPLMAWQCIALA